MILCPKKTCLSETILLAKFNTNGPHFEPEMAPCAMILHIWEGHASCRLVKLLRCRVVELFCIKFLVVELFGRQRWNPRAQFTFTWNKMATSDCDEIEVTHWQFSPSCSMRATSNELVKREMLWRKKGAFWESTMKHFLGNRKSEIGINTFLQKPFFLFFFSRDSVSFEFLKNLHIWK